MSVKLPKAVIGQKIVIRNSDAAKDLKIWPNASEEILRIKRLPPAAVT